MDLRVISNFLRAQHDNTVSKKGFGIVYRKRNRSTLNLDRSLHSFYADQNGFSRKHDDFSRVEAFKRASFQIQKSHVMRGYTLARFNV